MKTIRFSFPAVLVLAAALTAPFSITHAELVGITRDSEYLLFVIDSSGSMRRYEWDRVVSTFEETLAIYPTVKGIQVLNDQGDYLLISYRREWIPDTPANREWIVRELGVWEAYSTSNPRRGILTAIDTFYDPDKAIALFVLGDDVSSGANGIDGLIAEVDRRNSVRADGVPRVRIHTVAFPIFYDVIGPEQFAASTGAGFASSMSTLSQSNAGRFLGLSSRHVGAAVPAADGAEGIPAAGANRVLILVDTSANMREPYWRQAVETVDWIIGEAGEGDRFQVMALTAPARSVVAGSEGLWLGNADGSLRERVVSSLRELTPEGAVDLGAVTAVVRGLDPGPDRVYVLAAGDPGIGPQNLPPVSAGNLEGAPIDFVLFGAGDNPQVVPFYWSLALEGGGTLVAPAEDWP